jgi:hypothetical protein
MRSKLLGALMAVLVGGLTVVGVAGPASAEPVCHDESAAIFQIPDAGGIISTGGGVVTVDPTAVAPYIDALTGHLLATVPAYALCMGGGSVLQVARCVADVALNLPGYVHGSPGGPVSIEYQRLFDDARTCTLDT